MIINQELDHLRATGQEQEAQMHEVLLREFYGTTDFRELWVLVELNIDPIAGLQGELSYAEAAIQAQQSTDVQGALTQIADASMVSVDSLHYLLYANVIIAHIPSERLLDVATIPQVAWVHNGMVRLVPLDYNGPANYGLTGQGVNSELLNQVDVDGLGIRVGIIDTGAKHPDLNDVLIAFQDLADMDIVDVDIPMGRGGHGTHVAGIVHQIATEANLYVAALDFDSPLADWMAQLALGLEWLLQRDVDVINLSLGYSWIFASGKNGDDGLSELVNRAVNGYYWDGTQFVQTSARPVVVVAAGNSAQAHDSVSVNDGDDAIRDLYVYDWSPNSPLVVLYWHGSTVGTTFSLTAPDGTAYNGLDLRTTYPNVLVDPYWDGALICVPPDAWIHSQDLDGNLETWRVDIANNSGANLDYHLEAIDSLTAFDLTGLGDEMTDLLGTAIGLDPDTPRNEFDDNDRRFSTIAPSEARQVITVGAVDEIGQLAGFSSQGPMVDGRIKPDVVASGVDVWSTYAYLIDTSLIYPNPPAPYGNLPQSFHPQGYRISPVLLAVSPTSLNLDLTRIAGFYYVLLYDSIDDGVPEWNTFEFDENGDFSDAVGPVQIGDVIPFTHTPEDVTLDYIDPGGEYAQATTYLQNSGTSMAAPHVAGAAALLIDHFRSLGYTPTPAQIKALLMNAAVDENSRVQFYKNAITGAGRPDVYRAALGDIFQGEGAYWDDSDTVSVQRPVVLPTDYLPAKGTLYWDYWDESVYYFTLDLSGGGGSRYDTTAIAYDNTPTEAIYPFDIQYWGIAGPVGNWSFASTYLPVRGLQVDGDNRRGFWNYSLNVSPGWNTYAIRVPSDGDEALRAIVYWADPSDNLDLGLESPSGKDMDFSTLAGVAVEQVHTHTGPMEGDWVLYIQNHESQDVSAALMVNYPVPGFSSYRVYLPAVLEDRAIVEQ